ncbi:hypothetical protein [Devosia sp.]|uniref:hypothetical protein n=1 Tax=Devosia sp. TaxID=1871048 RepID=UPI0025C56C66|nr:hypothetical protein [Devosia sp.]
MFRKVIVFLTIALAAFLSTLWQGISDDNLPNLTNLRLGDDGLVLLDNVTRSLVIEERPTSSIEYIVSAELLRQLLSGGNSRSRAASHFAFLEVVLNFGQFSGRREARSFYQKRAAHFSQLDASALARILVHANNMGYHLQIDRMRLSAGQMATVRLLPQFITRAFDDVPGDGAFYEGHEFAQIANLLEDRPPFFSIVHAFDPGNREFRGFFSGSFDLSPSNQFAISDTTTAANFSPGLFPASPLTQLFAAAREHMEELDALVDAPGTTDEEKDALIDEIDAIANELVLATEAAVAMLSTPPLRATASQTVADQTPSERAEWQEFARQYDKNAKSLYDTLKKTAVLVGIDDPAVGQYIDNIQTLTNLAMAASTQNYVAVAAIGVQIAGEIFGSGSGGSQGQTAALLKQLAAIRRDIANLRQEMNDRFDRVDRALSEIDRKLDTQFAFLISNFRLIEDQLTDLNDLATSSAEEEYQFRLNALASQIDTYNVHFWTALLSKRSTPEAAKLAVVSEVDTFMSTYLASGNGNTGIAHPRFVGSTNCYDRLRRDLETAQDTKTALENTIGQLLKALRSGDFDGKAQCVDRLFSTATLGDIAMRPSVLDAGQGVEWLPGYVDADGLFHPDGINMLFSPSTVLTANTALDSRLLLLQDPDILSSLLEKRIVRLTDTTKNMFLVGSPLGFKMISSLYMSLTTQVSKHDGLLLNTLFARAFRKHSQYVSRSLFSDFGTLDGVYQYYRLPTSSNINTISWLAADSNRTYFARLKASFDAQRAAVKGRFEGDIRSLAINIDEIVINDLGGYRDTLSSNCSSISACLSFTYTGTQKDVMLTIDHVAVGHPSLSASSLHPQAGIVGALLAAFRAEAGAASKTFNDVGDLSHVPTNRLYHPGSGIPEAKIVALENAYGRIVLEFRSKMKEVALEVEGAYSGYLASTGAPALADTMDSYIDVYLAGRVLERNFNEVLEAYRASGLAADLAASGLTGDLDYFDRFSTTVGHLVRTKCGTNYNEPCRGMSSVGTRDQFPTASLFFPFLVGLTPEKEDKSALGLFFVQSDGDGVTYSTGKGWMSGPRDAEPHIRSEVPAVDVSSLGAGGAIFPFLDPEFLFEADSEHQIIHRGLVGEGAHLSAGSPLMIGQWTTPLPYCDEQVKGFAASSTVEQALFKIDDLASVPFGSVGEWCDLGAKMVRYLAMSERNSMFAYAVNQAAVDYLASTRGVYKADSLLWLLRNGVVGVGDRLRGSSAFDQFMLGELNSLQLGGSY